jgi:protein transport protein HofC
LGHELPENPWKADQAAAEAPPFRPRSGLGLRHLMAAVVVFAVLFWVAITMGVLAVFVLVPIAPFVFAGGAVVFFLRRRTARQDGMLWVLTVAARRRMPLGPGIEAFAALCSGRYRARALFLAQMLDSGVALPQALRRVPGVLPADAAFLASVGYESGALADALGDAANARTNRQPYRRALVVRLIYLAGVLFVIQTVTGFLLYFIAPKLEAIIADFGTGLPEITRLLIVASHSPFAFGGWILLYLLEFALLIYLPLAYVGVLDGGSLEGRRFTRLSYLFYLGDVVLTPIRLFRRRHTAAILRALATCVSGDRPLSAGMATLAREYPRPSIRYRLTRAWKAVERGDDWREALRSNGLINQADAAVLDAAQRVGNLPWALRSLADGIERRLGYRLMALIQGLFPLVIIALGVLVGLIVVGYFMPLITLINALSETM